MREITGLILAGGQGRRMGGVDKGLTRLRGRPMIAWVLERLVPQVEALVINANQNLEQYRSLGYPVVTDEIGGFAGPLAGLQAGMRAARTTFVLTCPCDSPFLPTDLAARLFAALDTQAADLAVVKTGTWHQPVFTLVRTALLPQLTAFLEKGGRKVDAWYAALKVVEVAFDDQEQAFSNINTPDELRAFESPI
jgi:molybdopterin-guanine dinucleotide biosynthesis protein A